MRATYLINGFVLTLFAVPGRASAENWPNWRGPQGNGISSEQNLPLEWSTTKNVRWKSVLPEAGNSTPIVWGDRIFLTQSLDKGKRRALICFARSDGKQLWQQEIECAVKETTHSDNPPCSSSPVTDGKAVYANFGSAGVLACDFYGKKLWRRDLGPLLHVFGNGSSPALYKARPSSTTGTSVDGSKASRTPVQRRFLLT